MTSHQGNSTNNMKAADMHMGQCMQLMRLIQNQQPYLLSISYIFRDYIVIVTDHSSSNYAKCQIAL